MKFSDLGDNIAKAFTSLIPNGDKVYSQFTTLDNMQGQYTVSASGRFDDVAGFSITGTDASGNKTSTYVTVEQAKAGNWNPETNVLDTNQTFSVSDDGKVVGTPVATTPTGSTTTNTNGTSTPSTTPSGGTTGSSGSTTDEVIIDFDKVDSSMDNIAKNFKNINTSLNNIKTSLNSIKTYMKGNGLDTQIDKVVKTCEKRYNYNSKKASKLRSDVSADTNVIIKQLQQAVALLQESANKSEKNISASSV